MNMKWYALLFSVLAFLTLGTGPTTAAADKVYINGIDASYPPFTFLNKNGSPDGVDVQAVDWIAREMGFQVRHVPMDWATIIASLRAKEIDFIASGMSVTQERRREVDFSIPYCKTAMVLITRQGSNLTVAEALTGSMKWGVQRGTNEVLWIERNLLKRVGSFPLVLYPSAGSAMEAVLNQGVDCAAVSLASAENFAKRGRSIKIIGPYGQPDQETAYAVRKGDTVLLRLLNQGLEQLLGTPYWKELKTRYGLR